MTYGGVETWLHVRLASVLDMCVVSFTPCSLYPQGRVPASRCVGRWLGPCREWDPDSSAVQALAMVNAPHEDREPKAKRFRYARGLSTRRGTLCVQGHRQVAVRSVSAHTAHTAKQAVTLFWRPSV
jgi:hypothetical protein